MSSQTIYTYIYIHVGRKGYFLDGDLSGPVLQSYWEKGDLRREPVLPILAPANYTSL